MADPTQATLFTQVLAWTATHPGLALTAIFFIAFGESLVVVGMVVPGALLLVGAGALVALGALPFGPVMAVAAAGAICGDALGYWLGRHYRDHLRDLPPFRRHPEILARGERFFLRHGGKGVAMGRFFGPIRAVIPAVAGMMGMSPARFLLANILSALAWAPAYLLPGIAFGTSLELASEMAMRMVLALLLVAGTLLGVVWLIRHLVKLLQPRAAAALDRLMEWSHRHPLLGRFTEALVDPRHPDARALFGAAVVLLATGPLLAARLVGVTGRGGPTPFDRMLFELLQGLRSPGLDLVAAHGALPGSLPVIAAAVFPFTLWLVLRGNRAAALHLAGALVFGVALSQLMHQLLPYTPPLGEQGRWGGEPAIMATLAYGFMSVVLAREIPPPRRWMPYVVAGLLTFPSLVGGLYFGTLWLSQLTTALLLGLFWLLMLGIAYRRHPAPRMQPLPTVSLPAVTLTLGVLLVPAPDFPPPPLPEGETLPDLASWRTEGWQRLPAWREDLQSRHSHPLNLQWAGSLEGLEQTLERSGWRAPPTVTFTGLLGWLAPEPEIGKLPVLPHLHAGRYQDLLLVRTAERKGSQWVLRLWNSGWRIGEGNITLWIGSLTRQSLRSVGGLITYPATDLDFQTPLVHFSPPPSLAARQVRRPARSSPGWDGEVLLLWEGESRREG